MVVGTDLFTIMDRKSFVMASGLNNTRGQIFYFRDRFPISVDNKQLWNLCRGFTTIQYQPEYTSDQSIDASHLAPCRDATEHRSLSQTKAVFIE